MKMKQKVAVASVTVFLTTFFFIAWFKVTTTSLISNPEVPGSLSLSHAQYYLNEDEYISVDNILQEEMPVNITIEGHTEVNDNALVYKYELEEEKNVSASVISESHEESKTGDEHGSLKNKILVFTSYRTGSTFTGELFKQNPEVFYLFEPLKLVSLVSRDTSLQDHIVEYLDDCFNCRFERLITDSIKFFPSEKNLRKLWYQKIFDQPVNWHGELNIKQMEKLCKKYDIHAIKIIRGNRIQDLFPLMENGLKVIHLVRDPRGTITSRLQIESLKSKRPLSKYWTAKDQKLLERVKSECMRYLNTYEMLQGKKVFSENQEKLLTSQYRLVRYEDIAYNPEYIASELYRFLNLPIPAEVKEWLFKSTSYSSSTASPSQNKRRSKNQSSKILSEAYTTSRNSSATAEAWRNKMPFLINLEIQKLCGDMLRKYGYRRVYSRTEYKDLSMSLVRNSLVQPKFMIS